MDKDGRVEEQIRHFYDSVPNIDDALPLKEHLLKHEDSPMAWYLLGKQYERQGQQAKAAYCFGQAGEIYEAFEDKPAPKLPDERSDKHRSRKPRGGGLLIGSALILAFAVLAALAALAILRFDDVGPADGRAATVAEERGQWTSKAISIVRASTSVQPHTPGYRIGEPHFIAGISGPDHGGRKQLGEFLTGRKLSQRVLVVRSPQIGKWTDWIKSGMPVASLTSGGDPGKADIVWYDPKWCVCIPHESKAAQAGIRGWKPLQEEKLLLRSAMVRYRQRTGQWPETPESLAGAYPGNTMAGWTEAMTAWFQELKAVTDRKPTTAAGWPRSSGPAAGHGIPAGMIGEITEQPLTVIVDKSNHRLAVVSGNVLLRNYKVGLGGDGTPEGNFVISEKVRNPNGRSDGVFGSRGLTLSDSRYAIHGTDEPDSIGTDESLGCIRMLQEDLEELYDLIPAGTTVTIAKGGLPVQLRTPPERFRLPAAQDETNPGKVFDWLT